MQISAALFQQIETYQRGVALRTRSNMFSAISIKDEKLRARLKAATTKINTLPLGPGYVTVRFTVANDGHPVGVYSLSRNATEQFDRKHIFLRQSAESVVLGAGPYLLKPQHYEITLTYPQPKSAP